MTPSAAIGLNSMHYSFRNIILALFATLAVALFSHLTGLPVTILDLLLLPISICFLFVMVRLLFSPSAQKKDRHQGTPPSPTKCFGAIILFLLMAVLGGWSTWMGALSPLTLFSGVRGGVYGYTMVPTGLCLIAIALYAAILTARCLIRHWRGEEREEADT